MGKDTDILELNVGGRLNIAVSRRTLTQFEDSVLAAQFSGRWDLEKDRNGNIFVDQNPDDFLILVDFLRLRMNSRSRQVPAKHLPKPTYSLCSMLEYYDLMSGVYPQSQSWVGSDFKCEEKSYGHVVLSSKSKLGTVMACAVLNFGKFSDVGVSEFTCEFDRGTKGAVGWVSCIDKGEKSVTSQILDKVQSNSIFLNVTERKIYGPDKVLEENMNIDCSMSATKIICRHDGKQEYSIEVTSHGGGTVAAKLVKKTSQSYSYIRVFPMVSFNGKVTVSGLKYAIEEL